jgi:Leucine-rich repeat (LRR) protein
MSIGTIAGRQLQCNYVTEFWEYWRTFQLCKLYQVDFSESFQTETHSFTGSSSEKSGTSMFYFQRSPKIDFLPKEIPKEFPNLKGLDFGHSELPVIKSDLFPEDFRGLEILYFGDCQIESIEPFAFQHLTNLKWLNLFDNKIQSLPYNLFQNNQKLTDLYFDVNQIDSISPNLFKNLRQLKWVSFWNNHCVREQFGCKECSRPLSDLESGLSECFQNCLKDPDCATKSELVEIHQIQVTATPPPKEEDLPDFPNQSNSSATANLIQSLQINLTQELAKISEQLKSIEEKLEVTLSHRENALKLEFNEIISKRLAKFEFKFRNETRP